MNCTVSGNNGGAQGAAINLVNSNVTVLNSILWDNSPQEMVTSGLSNAVVRYSDIAGGISGQAVLDADPLFVLAGSWVDINDINTVVEPNDPNALWIHGDYHLKSEGGTWDPATLTWFAALATSPCLDAGDPNSPVGMEPAPHGDIVNLGAYGASNQASQTPVP